LKYSRKTGNNERIRNNGNFIAGNKTDAGEALETGNLFGVAQVLSRMRI